MFEINDNNEKGLYLEWVEFFLPFLKVVLSFAISQAF